MPLLVAGLLLASAAATGLAACGDDSGGGSETSLDLTIGNLVPLTGDLSAFGPPGQKAADLAVKQIQSAAKEAGANHNVEIAHGDDGSNSQAGVKAARKLVDGENARCLAGGWGSPTTIPVAQSVAINDQVLMISPASTEDAVTDLKDNGFVNRTSPPDRFQGPALANVVEEALGGAQGKTANIGARRDPYGTGLADTFSTAWEGKGGRVGERVIYDPDQPSYNTEALKIAGGDPDAYVIFDYPPTYENLGPALVRTRRWEAGRTFVTDALASSDLPKSVGAEATEDMRGTAPGAPDTGAASVSFDKLYRNAEGPGRQMFDAHAFDAVILCYLAAVAADNTEGPDMAKELAGVSAPGGDKYTWEQLPDAIKALEDGKDIDYEGASGPIDLNEDGDPTAGVYDVFRYREGKVDVFSEVPIEPPQ